MSNYDYQKNVANKIIKDLQNNPGIASVLAAAPGAGKTTISQIVISEYLKIYPQASVLVLTHGQNVLKNQYIQNIKESFVNINFKYLDFNKEKNINPQDYQVYIGIPHSINKLKINKIDLLVVDECHQFYLKPMVQNIIKQVNPKHQLLMTGSPSEFIYLNNLNKKYEINFIAGDYLIKKDVFSSVVMDVAPIDKRISSNSISIIKKMISYVETKKYDLSKIMIAVNTIKEAFDVASYLETIGRKVALSTTHNDPEGTQIIDFKKNKYDTLIVVQRGVLGFSDNNITGIFDLKCSNDVDVSNQLFSRVLRKHPKNIKKFYLRCGDKNTKDFNNQVIMLHKIKALMDSHIYKTYNGKNMEVNLS